MIEKMARTVEVGSEWYCVSMTWINKWQKFVNFEGEEIAEEDKKPPGKIDNTDIIQQYSPYQKVLKGE